ncbi:MAG: hypothetical protein HRT87_07505 [Legionellales bacterium]|nr:hypothetical protein [Legionellales bacterium]
MGKIKINIPSTLREIKLSQYQKYLRVIKDVEDERLISRYAVSIFCNLPDKAVKAMTRQSFDEVLTHINTILSSIDSNVPLTRTFHYKGRKYGLVPNFDKISIGELIDCDNNIHDWQKMHIVMNVLFREIEAEANGKYIVEKYDEEYLKKEHNLDVPLDIALGCYFFLQNLLGDLLKSIPSSIKAIIQQDKKLKTLVENGDGLKASMDLLNIQCLEMSKMLQK